MPCVRVLTRSNFWRLYSQFRANPRDTLYCPSSDEILNRLKALCEHAYSQVPFYRERMAAAGVAPERIRTLEEFRKVPPTSKSDVARNFPERLTASDQAFRPWRYVSTSGTMERLTVIQDFRKRDFVRTTQLLALNAATGYRPGMKYLEMPPDICRNLCGGADTVEPNVFRYFLESCHARRLSDPEVVSNLRGLVERQIVYRQLVLPSFGSEGLAQKTQVLDQYIDRIDQYRPHVVKALPVYLYLLALRILERESRPPRITGGIMPMGSSMTPHMKRVTEAAFQCRVHEDYGCAELGAIGAECGRQNGIHPFAALFYVEVVRGGRPVNDGEVGKILITDLYNYAMPLIRYDIGDMAVFHRGHCGCGLPSERLDIQGRLQDCLVAGDGTVLTPDRVVDTVLERPDVLGFQVELRNGGRLHLQVVPRGSNGADLQGVCAALGKLLGSQVEISARTVSTILPEPGGKFRFVKNLSESVKQIL